MTMLALSLVEKGWAGSRRVAIRLSAAGISVRHLVRGSLPREVVRVISPYPGVAIRGVPVRWYRVAAWSWLMLAQFRRGVAWLLVDNEKTARWAARWFPRLRAKLVLIQETGTGDPLAFRNGAPVALDALEAP